MQVSRILSRGIRSYSNAPGDLFPAVKTAMLPADCFAGKVAFVTGGGTGLGRGIAHTLSALGARVAIASRKAEVLETTAGEISKATGNEVRGGGHEGPINI